MPVTALALTDRSALCIAIGLGRCDGSSSRNRQIACRSRVRIWKYFCTLCAYLSTLSSEHVSASHSTSFTFHETSSRRLSQRLTQSCSPSCFICLRGEAACWSRLYRERGQSSSHSQVCKVIFCLATPSVSITTRRNSLQSHNHISFLPENLTHAGREQLLVFIIFFLFKVLQHIASL